MRTFDVHACSDVTGFGLLGHALEMAAGSGVTLVLRAGKLPLLPGARRLAEQGFLTGGCRRNRDYLADKVGIDPAVGRALTEIAFDPQTSGGLLIAVPKDQGPRLVRHLKAKGVTSAGAIGYATARQDVWVKLV